MRSLGRAALFTVTVGALVGALGSSGSASTPEPAATTSEEPSLAGTAAPADVLGAEVVRIPAEPPVDEVVGVVRDAALPVELTWHLGRNHLFGIQPAGPLRREDGLEPPDPDHPFFDADGAVDDIYVDAAGVRWELAPPREAAYHQPLWAQSTRPSVWVDAPMLKFTSEPIENEAGSFEAVLAPDGVLTTGELASSSTTTPGQCEEVSPYPEIIPAVVQCAFTYTNSAEMNWLTGGTQVGTWNYFDSDADDGKHLWWDVCPQNHSLAWYLTSNVSECDASPPESSAYVAPAGEVWRTTSDLVDPATYAQRLDDQMTRIVDGGLIAAWVDEGTLSAVNLEVFGPGDSYFAPTDASAVTGPIDADLVSLAREYSTAMKHPQWAVGDIGGDYDALAAAALLGEPSALIENCDGPGESAGYCMVMDLSRGLGAGRDMRYDIYLPDGTYRGTMRAYVTEPMDSPLNEWRFATWVERTPVEEPEAPVQPEEPEEPEEPEDNGIPDACRGIPEAAYPFLMTDGQLYPEKCRAFVEGD